MESLRHRYGEDMLNLNCSETTWRYIQLHNTVKAFSFGHLSRVFALTVNNFVHIFTGELPLHNSTSTPREESISWLAEASNRSL